MPAEGRGGRARAAALLLPAALAILVHARSLGHGFIVDDATLVVGNPQITAPGRLVNVLATDWFDTGRGSRIGYYRPVVKLSLRATWAVFGGRPAAHHAVNLLVHASAVLFLGLLLRRLVPPGAAAIAAAVFAVHPSTVQAVDIVTARSDLLAGAFVLAACALFARLATRDRPPVALEAALAATALLAFGSKESALLLPLPLAAVGLAQGLGARRLARFLLPVVGAEALFLLVRARIVHVAAIPNNLAALDPLRKAGAVLAAIGAYAWRLATGLPIIRLPQVPDSVTPAVVGGALVVCVAAAVLVRTRGRSAAAFAVALLFASLAPVLAIGYVHIPRWKDELPLADRWLYLPAAAAGILASLLVTRLPAQAARIAAAALVTVFAATTWERSAMYSSEEAMTDYAAAEYLAADPKTLNPRERYLAIKMRARRDLLAGRIAEGLEGFLEAGRLAPGLPDHLPVIAQAELELGRPDRAADALERLLSPAFAANPDARRQREDFGSDEMQRFDRAQAWHLLGRAYGRLGRPADAAAAFEQAAAAARGKEDEAAYLVDWAAGLERSGDSAGARAALERATTLRPDWERPRQELRRLASPP